MRSKCNVLRAHPHNNTNLVETSTQQQAVLGNARKTIEKVHDTHLKLIHPDFQKSVIEPNKGLVEVTTKVPSMGYARTRLRAIENEAQHRAKHSVRSTSLPKSNSEEDKENLLPESFDNKSNELLEISQILCSIRNPSFARALEASSHQKRKRIDEDSIEPTRKQKPSTFVSYPEPKDGCEYSKSEIFDIVSEMRSRERAWVINDMIQKKRIPLTSDKSVYRILKKIRDDKPFQRKWGGAGRKKIIATKQTAGLDDTKTLLDIGK